MDAKHAEMLQKNQQLTFEIREREREREREMTRLQCNDNIDCYWLLRWKQSHVTNQIGRLISDEKKTSAISNKMVKTILFESKSITRKLLSELV